MKDKKHAILITGASSGIGKSLTKIFVENNFHVIGAARRLDLLQELKQSFNEKQNYCHPFFLDISNKDSIQEFFNNISSDFIIDCLINNAGISSFKKAIDDSFDEIESVIQTNLVGPILAIKKILPSMIEEKSGTIINILSVVNKKIFTNSSVYSASKNGLEAYAKVLREEHRNDNIRVINVFPGATATEIWPAKSLEKYSARMMNPDEIANLIFQVYQQKNNLCVEELVVRPITGDL